MTNLYSLTLAFKDKEMSLENRAIMFQETLHKICISQKIKPTAIYVEEPFSMFSGGKTTANTMAKLQRFNGMCCLSLRLKYGFNPETMQARTCRSLNEIKIPRGSNTKKLIIDWAQSIQKISHTS